jgi:hypothetical protein
MIHNLDEWVVVIPTTPAFPHALRDDRAFKIRQCRVLGQGECQNLSTYFTTSLHLFSFVKGIATLYASIGLSTIH